MATLTDPATKQLLPTRIAALPDEHKDAVVAYLIDKKRPIIAGFVTPKLVPLLRAADYPNGYSNAYFNFWIRPGHQSAYSYNQPGETVVTGPERTSETAQEEALPIADEKQNHPTFRPDLQQAINAEMESCRDESKLESDSEPPEDSPQWGKPEPIKTSLLSVLSVHPSMIPEPFRAWLTDIAHRMKCPLDFVTAPAVVMLSALVGTRLTIKPKQRDDWTIVPNLWGADIGGPSTMKTPTIGEVLKPLSRLVLAARTEFEETSVQYDRDLIEKVYTSQAQERHKGKPVSTPVSYPEAPAKPKERRYVVNDTSIEKAADLLNENPTGLLLMRDELTGWLSGLERSGHEQDRSFYLEAWNGNGSMTIDRIGRGTTHVNVICISLFGGIQPAKLLPYLQAATSYENDGLVQRLQVAVFPDPTPFNYSDESPDKAARDRAFDFIQKIANSDFASIGYPANDYDKFPYTRFSVEAQEIFKQWLIEWETNVLPNESGLLLEHFTKYRSLMPSLALLFHVVNCVDLPSPADPTQKQLVSADAAAMAIEWCTYLQSHARRIYGLLDTQSVEAAKSLLAHLKTGHLKDGFKARDIQHKGWANLSTLDMVESAISELISHNWLMEIQPPPPVAGRGRPEAPYYLINPEIIQNV